MAIRPPRSFVELLVWLALIFMPVALIGFIVLVVWIVLRIIAMI